MADILDEIRDNRRFAEAEWDAIRKEARVDKLCVAGKPWEALDPQAVKERKDAKRPYLASDELGQYINQTVNDVRANPRGIKYAPTGNGANDKGAEFYQNHTREIEYRSNAKVAYATAFEGAVTSGAGWLRITSKRDHVRTFNQNLWIEPIVNADQVLADPNGVWPDSRDIKFLYYIEPWLKSEFIRQFPKAKIRSFGSEQQKVAGTWMRADTLDVAEYWHEQTYQRQLIAYRPMGGVEGSEQVALLDELPEGKLPEGVDNLREEEVDDTKITFYRTNGLEILDEQDWRGKYIPFVSCYGKILYVDEGAGSTRHILSMTRLARSPYMLACYLETCLAEAVGGVPRANWVGYEGQFAKPDRWTKSNRQPVAFLEAKATVPGVVSQGPLPLPQRQPWDPPIQNLLAGSDMASRKIQASMGVIPLPSEAQRRNDVSGVEGRRRESAGQKGSFHFVDHHDLMIERVGMILEDLMDKTLDTARDVPVRDNQDSAAVVRINDPNVADPIFTKGDYRVTISVGPATESQREDAASFVDSLVQNIGEVAQLIGPQKAGQVVGKSVKLKQLGPYGEEIAELFEPPQPLGADGKPLPPEVMQLHQQNQQLQQELQQVKMAMAAKLPEIQSKEKIAQMQEQGDTLRAGMERETKLAIAEITAQAKQALQDMALFYEERSRIGAQIHEHAMGSKEIATNVALANHAAQNDAIENAKDRVAEVHGAIIAHAHKTAQADQATEGAMAVQDNAPAPTNGSGA